MASSQITREATCSSPRRGHRLRCGGHTSAPATRAACDTIDSRGAVPADPAGPWKPAGPCRCGIAAPDPAITRAAAPGHAPPEPSPGPPENANQVKTDQAREAAHEVAGEAQDAGRAVKDTAVNEAAGVKDDAVQEVRRLGDEALTTLKSQASAQMQRAAGTARSFSDDVDRMAHGKKPEPGIAADLADQLNARADFAATWLEQHEPADVLDEVQRFARNRPAAFIGILAGIGFAAGRLTRGMSQNRTDSTDQEPPGPGPDADRAAGPGPTSAPAATTDAAASGPAPVSGTPGPGAPAY